MPEKLRNGVRGTAVALGALALSWTLGATPAMANCRDIVSARGVLRDFNTAAPSAFDDAYATARIVRRHDGSKVSLRVRHVDRAAAGHVFGAHLHLGPCVTDDAAAALGHYNTDVLAGRTPPVVNETTEIWLDFAVTKAGKGRAVAQVPFVPLTGTRSIVIHEHSTAPDGTAGPRLACLPVEW